MPPSPVFAGVIYDTKDIIQFPVGATAIRYGDICKITSNLLVPAADNDKQLQFYVALESALASATNLINCVELTKCQLEIAYTGTPTVGDAFGISDARTLDAADATNYLLRVTKVNTARTTVNAVAYQITA